MATSPLNTQTGYRAPRTPRAGQSQVARQPSYLTRQLAGGSPSTYTNPYAAGVGGGGPNPTYGAPPTPQLPAGPIQTPSYPTTPQAPAGTPSTYTQQAPQAPQAPAGYTFDLETDPVLQQMHAMAANQRAQAESSALAQRKQLAIQYGDQNYGNSIDQGTGQAAQQNPNSVLANLATQYQRGTQNTEENLNAHNLFYSGERIHELAQALQDYQSQQAQAAQAEQTGLGNIDQNRIAALMGADQSEQGAYQDAYNRALQQAQQDQYQQFLLQQQLAQQQPAPTSPSYTGQDGSQVTPTTYDSIGATPNAITSSMVAPPQPVAGPSLLQYLAANPLRLPGTRQASY